MPSIKNSVWVLCTTGLLLICLWQWLESTRLFSKHRGLDSDRLEQTTNMVIYDLTYQQYDNQGRLTHCLETPEIHHIPKNDMHILTAPHILITEPNQAPWEIHADQGTAVSKAQKITFNHHVIIHQHKPDQEMLLKTEQLIYYPQEKKAISSVEVEMIQGDTQVRSTGLEANLTNNRIHLENVRGRHVQHG